MARAVNPHPGLKPALIAIACAAARTDQQPLSKQHPTPMPWFSTVFPQVVVVRLAACAAVCQLLAEKPSSIDSGVVAAVARAELRASRRNPLRCS